MEKGSTKSIYRFFQLFLIKHFITSGAQGRANISTLSYTIHKLPRTNLCTLFDEKSLTYERITHWHLPGGPFLELKATWFRDSLWSLRDPLPPINNRKNQITAICNFNFCWDPKPFLTVDGWNPASTSWGWYFIPLSTNVLYIPGGCLGFLNHQQYHL